jgi:hypothetical protein
MSTVMARQIAASGGRRCGWRPRSPSPAGSCGVRRRATTSSRICPGHRGWGRFLHHRRGFVQRPIDGDLGQVESDDPVERGERFGAELVETPPQRSTHRDGLAACVRDPVFEDCFDVDPRRPRGEADQDSPEHQPVGHPWPVAAKRVDWGLGQERLDRRIHGVYNLAFECAHDGGDLPGRRLWIALGMKTEPTRRPADGHLSARVLSSLLASLTTSRGESVRWLPS